MPRRIHGIVELVPFPLISFLITTAHAEEREASPVWTRYCFLHPRYLHLKNEGFNLTDPIDLEGYDDLAEVA